VYPSSDLVSRISGLAAGVSGLAAQVAGDAAAGSPSVLGPAMERMNRGLDTLRAGSSGSADLHGLLTEISSAQSALHDDADRRSARATERVCDALGRLRAKSDAEQMLDAAPAEVCLAIGMDRAMISGVRGSIWTPRLVFLSDGLGGGIHRAFGDYLADMAITLASPMVEAEVVRRRLPALISDAQGEPRTCRPLVQASRTREFVVAPIVAGGAVIGLLHADTLGSGRPLGAADRDRLWAFAEGLGVSYECAVLESRVARRRERLSQAFLAAERILDEPTDLPVQLPGPALRGAAATTREVALPAELHPPEIAARQGVDGLSRLTPREREVLALLAHGATNAQAAQRLTVAESTVKSHVKHILHKMGAPNRAGAITRYLRAANNERRV
jgi:DNA-binding CsgD family transcriptional regulator